MKNSIHILCIVLVFALALRSHSASAQAPQAIPYQAIARSSSGSILSNQAISLRLSIHDASATGTIVYKETQTITTNSLGLFKLNIGQGTPITGTLSSVNWANGSKFIQVEMDQTGGTSYTDMGTTQLMSVPYALSSADNQWTKTGNDINNSNTGHVSIGTSNPIPYAKLTVQSDLYGLMHINGSTEIGTWADTSGGWLGTKSNHPLHLFTNDAAPQITLKQNGNLGIGTTTPSEKLTVMSDSNAIIRVETPSFSKESRIEFWKFGGLVGAGVGFYPGDGNLRLRSGENAAITFEADTLERMRVESNGNVGIGTNNPNAKLDINGTIRISGGNPGAGKVLTSDATGIASWTTPGTGGLGNGTAAGNTPYWNGVSWVTNSNNVYNNGGNVGIGTNTPSNKLTVNGSVNFGDASNVVSSVNSAVIGMQDTVTGYGSFALGRYNSATANHSIALGFQNHATNDQAFAINWGNTASGISSFAGGRGNTAASENETSIGAYGTLYTPTSTAIDRIFNIGNGTSSVARSDAFTILKNGNAGIGTATPGAKLHVNGIIRAQADPSNKAIELYKSNGTAGWEMYVNNTGLSFCEQGVACDRLFVAAGGNIGIGTPTPTNKLTVYNGTTTGNYTTSGWIHSSDARLKTNVKALNNSLEKLLKLNGVSYNWIKEPNSNPQIGFIAQDVEKVFPEVVVVDKDGNYGMAYQNLVAPLVEAIKEQQQMIESQQKQIDELKKLFRK